MLDYTTDKMSVVGYVNGYTSNVSGFATIYNETYAQSVEISSNGYYEFNQVPEGVYSVKAEISGYELAKEINVQVKKVNAQNPLMYDNVYIPNLYLTSIDKYSFYYEWSINEYCLGDEISSTINSTNVIEFDGNEIYSPNNSSTIGLLQNYNVILDETWSPEYASRLYDMFKKADVVQNRKSTWKIVNEHIANDIIINKEKNLDKVTISVDALLNSIPTSGTLNGTKGTFFSNRLYNSVIRYLTDNGTNTNLVKSILLAKYGVSIFIPDYTELTSGITNENSDAFQQFTPEELLSILCMYEEMPQGMHVIPGFNYLLRRKNGQLHPIYPAAAAVTWPSKGYIEYVDIAFTGNKFDTYRLIVHEKSHMLWANVFSSAIKEEWQEIGGWTVDANDEWHTSKQTEFVTAYSHDHNPNEDMAESIAYFICNPDKLKSRAPEKYEFIQNRIFNGSSYLRTIREDLTFEVFNLYPDYDYPGQVTKIQITSDSLPFEDKVYHITLYLNDIDGIYDGATSALLRVTSPNSKQIQDVWLNPTNESGSILEGDLKLSKYCQKGNWIATNLHIYDANGNQRFEKGEDFGFVLYVDNPLEDLVAPTFVQNSISITSTIKTVTDPNGNTRTYTEYDLKLKIIEDNPEYHGGTSQIRIAPIGDITVDAIDKYLVYDSSDGYFHAKINATENWANGFWEIRSITLCDEAGNTRNINSSDAILENESLIFEVVSTNPDTTGPTLDVNNIKITATPTNPNNPNGETVVTITIRVSDDISGYSHGSFLLRDSQGVDHYYQMYDNDNYFIMYYNGNPTQVKEYTIKIVLPAGSVPGKWGLSEMTLIDLVGNKKTYDFTETVQFNVVGNDSD